MPPGNRVILRVALPVPLRRCFDYLAQRELDGHRLQPGMRVRVPFGSTAGRTGIIISITDQSEVDASRLKSISGLIDNCPLFPRSHLDLLLWASDYYHHPVGEVLFSTLPVALRQGRPAQRAQHRVIRLTAAGACISAESLRRAPRQWRMITLLRESPGGVAEQELRGDGNAGILSRLREKGLVETVAVDPSAPVARHTHRPERGLDLNADQAAAVDAVTAQLGDYQRVLLQGVTGSGKTEVYIEIIRHVLALGKQSLVLVPEIGLTPQLVDRLARRLDVPIALLHSGMAATERLKAWIDARGGGAPLVLGTRSAVWTPLKDPGLIILDEEHDLSYKQQEGFRYSARDVAIMRGRRAGVPVILGSATPSMESLYNVRSGRFSCLSLAQRAVQTAPPRITIIDMRGKQTNGAISLTLQHAIRAELERRRQVLLFLNRRGYAPVLMCHDCGWMAKCSRCEIHLTWHKQPERLQCHHCGVTSRPHSTCPECAGENILPIGHGTERLEEVLSELFPGARILRIDRDSTRRRGSLQEMFTAITTGAADILVGTQMIAKGHHFPDLDLVGVIDADRGLFSSDFRASEHMAQLIVQVSGRAGRVSDRGSVYIQTWHPDHPLLQSLIHQGYEGFSSELLTERQQAQLPPFSYLALLRAEDYQAVKVTKFLDEARRLIAGVDPALEVYGPVPAPMEKKAGRQRYQLLLQSANRARLQKLVGPWSRQLESIPAGKQVRWSLDIDPMDMM